MKEDLKMRTDFIDGIREVVVSRLVARAEGEQVCRDTLKVASGDSVLQLDILRRPSFRLRSVTSGRPTKVFIFHKLLRRAV